MSKALLIEVTVYDDETHDVLQKTVEVYESSGYGWEVEKMFYSMGKRFAVVMDEGYKS